MGIDALMERISELEDQLSAQADAAIDSVQSRDTQIAKLRAQVERMRTALEAILEVHDSPCWHDHHGLCQEHHLREIEVDGKWVPQCEMQLVREALAGCPEAEGE